MTSFLASREVRRAARLARVHGERPEIVLSIVMVSDARLRKFHARFLGDATRTDVITFDLSDEIGGPQGEMYVSADCARRVARARGVDMRRELALYIVHGVLHLCGFDDRSDSDRRAMRAAETRVMNELGWAEDRAPHDTEVRTRATRATRPPSKSRRRAS